MLVFARLRLLHTARERSPICQESCTHNCGWSRGTRSRSVHYCPASRAVAPPRRKYSEYWRLRRRPCSPPAAFVAPDPGNAVPSLGAQDREDGSGVARLSSGRQLKAGGRYRFSRAERQVARCASEAHPPPRLPCAPNHQGDLQVPSRAGIPGLGASCRAPGRRLGPARTADSLRFLRATGLRRQRTFTITRPALPGVRRMPVRQPWRPLRRGAL